VRDNDGALRQIIDGAQGITACAALLAAEANVDQQEGGAALLAVLCSTRADAKQQAVGAGGWRRRGAARSRCRGEAARWRQAPLSGPGPCCPCCCCAHAP
jgi:hypothetical protein